MKLPEGIGFTSQDVNELILVVGETTSSQIAAKLNAKLPALFEAWVKREGVKVYGTTVGSQDGNIKWSHSPWVNIHRKDSPPCDTHTGYVVCREELKNARKD